MQSRFHLCLLLGLSAFSAAARADVSAGLGMNLTPNNDYFAERRLPEHLELMWSPAGAPWQLGGELNYRRARADADKSSVQAAGLRFVCGKALGVGRLYAGLAGGYMKLDVNRTNFVGTSSLSTRDVSEGYYLSPLAGYGLPLGQALSLSLEYQHVFERVADFHAAAVPAGPITGTRLTATSVNATGLQNINYTPYAGPEDYSTGSGHQDVDIVTLNLRWRF